MIIIHPFFPTIPPTMPSVMRLFLAKRKRRMNSRAIASFYQRTQGHNANMTIRQNYERYPFCQYKDHTKRSKTRHEVFLDEMKQIVLLRRFEKTIDPLYPHAKTW